MTARATAARPATARKSRRCLRMATLISRPSPGKKALVLGEVLGLELAQAAHDVRVVADRPAGVVAPLVALEDHVVGEELGCRPRDPGEAGVRQRALEDRGARARLLARCGSDLGPHVGRLLVLTGLVLAEPRLLRGVDRRFDALERERGDADLGARVDDRVGAAAGPDADVLAVGVTGAALAADPDEPVGRLLVDLADVVSGRIGVAVADLVGAPGDDDVGEAGGDSAGLLEEGDLPLRELGQLRDRRPQVGGQAAELVGRDQLRGAGG